MRLSMALHPYKQEEGNLQIAEGVWDSSSLATENTKTKENMNKILSTLNTHPAIEPLTQYSHC